MRSSMVGLTWKTAIPLQRNMPFRLPKLSIREENLAQDLELTFDYIRYCKVNGAAKDRMEIVEPYTTETTVEFTQIVNGIPVISQKRGRVRVSIDNDGRITRLQNDTRRIAGLSSHPRGSLPGPHETLRNAGIRVLPATSLAGMGAEVAGAAG